MKSLTSSLTHSRIYACTHYIVVVFHSNEVNSENSKRGYLAPLGGMPKEGWIHGTHLLTHSLTHPLTHPLTNFLIV